MIGIAEFLSFQAEVEQYETDMITNAVQDGRAISGMIAHTWKESGETKALELIRDASEAGTINIKWVWPHILINEFGGPLASKEQLQKTLEGKIVSFKMVQEDGSFLRYTYVPVDVGENHKGALELSQTLLSLQVFSTKMVVRAFTVTTLLCLVCGLILYWFIDRKIRLPLSRLTAHAKQIGQGDFCANTTIVGNDELAVMARSMNDMCSRLLIAKEKIKFEYDARLKTLDQLRHTERLSSFGVLSAEIAHELGTPLNVVDGRAKMIINEGLQKSEILDCSTIIRNQVERMTFIIRQLLDFTRLPKQQTSSDNIAFLTKQVFQLLSPMARKQRVSFFLHKEIDTEIQLKGDFAQLQQVLVNLLMNAIQAMPEGGAVNVRLSNEMIATTSQENRVRKKHLKIQIHDDGEGICKENLDQIFTPFFTTKNIGTGTGLGLSIAHGIIEQHNGWIDIESKISQGACFTIYLPMEE